MYEERQASPREMRQGRAELPLVDHCESIYAGMNEEAFESRYARGRQTFDVLLVVADHSAPRHPVRVALAAGGIAFCFERGHGRRRRQTVEWHVHQQRVTTSRGGACRRPESFPLRPPGFVDVDVRINEPRQNRSLTKVPHGNLLRQLIRCNNIEDSSVLDEHRRRFDSVRRHYPSREKSFETHVPGLRDLRGNPQQKGTATSFNSQGAPGFPSQILRLNAKQIWDNAGHG